MDQENQFVSENLNGGYDELVVRVTEEINDLPDIDLISGDRFDNLWEEIAYQVQIEENHNSHAYEFYVEALCRKIVGDLPEALVRQLWLLSDARVEWSIEKVNSILDTEVKEPEIESKRDGVVEELIKAVWKEAAEYSLPPYALYDLPKSDWSDGMMEDNLERIDSAEDEISNYDECVNLVILELRNHFLVSSQPNKDYWEEYIYVQGVVEQACYMIVEALPQERLLSLWKESIAICGWCDEDSEPETSEMQETVAQTLFQKVVCAAKYDDSFVWEDDEDDEEFELKDWDYTVIQVAINVIRGFLSQRKLPARHVVGLGKALYALERLPEVTPGIYCDYGICYPSGDEKLSEKKYISYFISDEKFSITTGRRLYDQSNEGDNITDQEWRIEIGSYGVKTLGFEPSELETEIREYLQLGAEIMVSDLSGEIDMAGE